MRIGRLTIVVLLWLILPAGASLAGGIVGVWATEGNKSHVRIEACGEKLCGAIIWLKQPLDDQGNPKRDANNPDPALQDRPIIGLPLLADFTAGDEANFWDGGTIYNPEDGEVYSSTMTLVDEDTLKVRGYVGLPLFGRSQIWTHVK